jgi:hypothetical protein
MAVKVAFMMLFCSEKLMKPSVPVKMKEQLHAPAALPLLLHDAIVYYSVNYFCFNFKTRLQTPDPETLSIRVLIPWLHTLLGFTQMDYKTPK